MQSFSVFFCLKIHIIIFLFQALLRVFYESLNPSQECDSQTLSDAGVPVTSCEMEIPLEWFSDESDVPISIRISHYYGSQYNLQSSNEVVVLKQKVQYESPTIASMMGSFALHAVCAGDQVSITLSCTICLETLCDYFLAFVCGKTASLVAPAPKTRRGSGWFGNLDAAQKFFCVFSMFRHKMAQIFFFICSLENSCFLIWTWKVRNFVKTNTHFSKSNFTGSLEENQLVRSFGSSNKTAKCPSPSRSIL